MCTGLGVVNSINMERPITVSVSDIGHQAINTASVLPVWKQVNQLEQLLVVKTLEKAQTSALQCHALKISYGYRLF